MKNFIVKSLKTIYDAFPVLNRPLAVCAVIACASILFLFNFSEVSLSLLALFLLTSIAVCLIFKNKKLVVISVLFLAVCISAVNELIFIDEMSALDGKTVTADVVAVEDSVKYEKVTKVTAYCAKSDSIPTNTKLDLYYFFDSDIKCGDSFSASIKVARLKDDRYKLSKLGNSIYAQTRLVKINEQYSPNGFFSFIAGIRHYISDSVGNNYSGDNSAVMMALTTGDRSQLSDEFYNRVLVCGVSHIMVVSGLHIAIILGTVFSLIEKFFYNRYLKALASLALIFVICALCGFTVSVIRAGAMFLFSAISPVFMRKNDPLNSLGASVVLILYITPTCVFNVAFWLSVLSTAAVVWIAPFYSDLIARGLMLRTRIAKTVVSVFIVSLSAMIFTAPVSLYVFGYISILSPVAFLLLTFPVTGALILNSAALSISSVGFLGYVAKPLFFCSQILIRYIRFIIDCLGQLDFMRIDADIYSFTVFLLLIFALVAAMYLYKFYVKLTKRMFVSEVKARAGNNGK